jgi:RNase H-like domain found in reverse transcriptase
LHLTKGAVRKFCEFKKEIRNIKRLMCFDEKKKTGIYCDDSKECLGTIVCQRTKGTDEDQVVKYASGVLRKSRKKIAIPKKTVSNNLACKKKVSLLLQSENSYSLY